MSTRVVAALAIIGGSAFAAGMLLYLLLLPPGARWPTPGTPESIVLAILGDGGLILLSAATWGAIFRFSDRTSPIAALVGAVTGLLGVLTAMGAYGALLFFPVGTAVVAWDLSRFGAVPRAFSVAHAAAALAFLVLLIATMTNQSTDPVGPAFIVLAVPYPLTWIGIGVALLLSGGLPVTDHPVPSAERPA